MLHLPTELQREITENFTIVWRSVLPAITEDTMPGELANCMAGRIANLYNFHGPNFVCDAACASAMAAISAAVKGLIENDFDVGGHRRHRPQHGCSNVREVLQDRRAVCHRHPTLCRGCGRLRHGRRCSHLPDEAAGGCRARRDKIYAVLRGIGGSSDGKGRASPRPIRSARSSASSAPGRMPASSPATGTLIEGHGTSTRVGDVVEAQSMADILSTTNLPTAFRGAGLGQVEYRTSEGRRGRSGNAEGYFGPAHKVLPPSLHCEHPSPDIDFAHSPLYVNTELKPWDVPADGVRRAGVSAFGFGGTNFHMVMEEYIPGRLNGNGKQVGRGSSNTAGVCSSASAGQRS